MTAGDAGFTLTWFADRRIGGASAVAGRERRRRSVVRKDVRGGIITDGGAEGVVIMIVIGTLTTLQTVQVPARQDPRYIRYGDGREFLNAGELKWDLRRPRAERRF